MAAFTEAERVQIRRWMGASALFNQLAPQLENAITTIQATSDGGTRPDSSSADYLRSILTQIQAIDNQIVASYVGIEATKVDEISVDRARGITVLKMEGRRRVRELANVLGFMGPYDDVFSPAKPVDSNSAWPFIFGGSR